MVESIRFTVHPEADVEVLAGTTFGNARERLAHITCRPELLTSTVRVGPTAIAQDHPFGVPPLVPGAVLVPDGFPSPPSASDGARAAICGEYRAVSVGGSECGEIIPLPEGSITSVGPLLVRRRGRRVRVRTVQVRAVQVRAAGIRGASARGTPTRGEMGARGKKGARLAVESARGRIRGPLAAHPFHWLVLHQVPWRAGRRIRTPGGVFELRIGPPQGPTPALPLTTSRAPSPRSAGSPTPARRRVPGPELASAIAPAIAMVGFALLMNRPILMLLALLGPLAYLVPRLVKARREAGSVRRVEDQVFPGPGQGPRPADLLEWATALSIPGAPLPDGEVDVPGPQPRNPLPGTDSESTPPAAIAIVGPRARSVAAARAVIADLLRSGPGLDVIHSNRKAADWQWCRWVPGARCLATPEDAGPALVVVDGMRASLTAWWTRTPSRSLVLIAASAEEVPAWCQTIVDVSLGQAIRHTKTGAVAEEFVGVSPAWAQDYARNLAAAQHLGRWPVTGPRSGVAEPDDPTIPSSVGLADALGMTSRTPNSLGDEVARRWNSTQRLRLDTVLGLGPGNEPVTIDLVKDGPHLLVAGTTGAGKSELLQSLITGLAMNYPPWRLSFALVDFKGGTSFGSCARLPHVVGQVTDLEPGTAGRAIQGLRAELHRRERVLNQAGVAAIDDLPDRTLARLVIVIDEFRALADDLPDFLPSILRIAAQGRSLGIHLVLATQRPAGAVNADIRANIGLRIALRVVDPMESRDVVDTDAAAAIRADHPGRAVIRTNSGPVLVMQCAYADQAPPRKADLAGYAPTWSVRGPAAVSGHARLRSDRTLGNREGGTERQVAPGGVSHGFLDQLVEAAVRAAAKAHYAPPPPPWLPPLPKHITTADIGELPDGTATAARPDGTPNTSPGEAADDGEADGDGESGLAFAIGDRPERQERAIISWRANHGHLGVLGRSRTGRSTTLGVVGWAALRLGWHVHALGRAADLGLSPDHPGIGTITEGDCRLAGRLLRILLGRHDGEEPVAVADPAHTLVLVDDVEDLRDTLGMDAHGGPGLLATAMNSSTAAFAVAGSSISLGGLDTRIGPRLVLSGTDRNDDLALGIPAAFAGQGVCPGRGVWLQRGDGLQCQVLVPAGGELTAGKLPAQGAAEGAEGTDTPDENELAETPPPVRLRPLPDLVAYGPGSAATGRKRVMTIESAAPCESPHREATSGPFDIPLSSTRIVLGLGGDDLRVVDLDAQGGLLIVGPAGSGRSSAALLVAEQCPQWLSGVISSDRRLIALARRHGTPMADRLTPQALEGVLTPLAERRVNDTRTRILVVDGLDTVTMLCALESEQIAQAGRNGVAICATASTADAAMAVRGPLAELRAHRVGLVLGPGERGSNEVFGHRLDGTREPGPTRAGRAVVVDGPRISPVQVAWVSDP